MAWLSLGSVGGVGGLRVGKLAVSRFRAKPVARKVADV